MKKIKKGIALFLFIFIISYPVFSQYFGKNKVNYEVFDFQIYETPHFEIYHYNRNESEIKDFGQLCERWYERHQAIFLDTLEEKNPIVLYNNHAEFQQTTVIQSLINVGTGGVTEGYRNRVVMPYSFSKNETNHVLGHEMVHVFQYNTFKKTDSIGLRSMGNIPLWMIEGLSEYLSIGSSDIKTAVWMRDAVERDDIPTLRDMSRKPDKYFPYRFGHVFWDYFTNLYGDGAIRNLLLLSAKNGYKDAIEDFTGLSSDSLSTLWADAVKETHRPYLEEKEESSGEKLFDVNNAGKLNIAPALSPDGKKLIFISNKNVITTDFFLADIQNKEIMDRITRVVRGTDIDAYSYLESAGTWSPDGNRFVITTFSEGRNKLLIIDVEDQKVIRTIETGSLQSFNNPEWSPEGNMILLSGLKNGMSDLYIYHLDTGELEQLTDDRYSDMQPNWSPDGTKIIFTSDRGSKTDLQEIKYGNLRMAVYDMSTKRINTIDILEGADIINPEYSPDGSDIYFVSNADGYRNLYRYNTENEEVRKVTDLKTGIMGVTGLSPCFDISQNTEEMVYILYTNSGYEIYKQELSELDGPLFAERDINLEAAELVETERRTGQRDIVDNNLKAYPTYTGERFSFKPYDPAFGLEYIGSPGIGVGASQYGTGMAGGASFLFSDILRRNLLMTTLQLQGRIKDISGQIFYMNQRSRFNWGVSFSHVPYRSSGATIKADTLEEMPVQNLVLIEQRVFQDRLNLMGQYPLSKKLRFEGGINASMYSFRVDSINNYYYGNVRVGRDRHQLDAPDSYFVYSGYLAHAGDNANFGLTSPMRGYRYRLQVDRTFGKIKYWGFLADYRKYFFLPPTSLGFRIMHFGRYGKSADELSPIFLGNEYFVRGYSFGSMSRNQTNADNSLNVNNLAGSKVIVGNAEFRIPLSGPKRLAPIGSRIIFSDFVLFADGGLVWSDSEDIQFNWEPSQGDKHIPVFSAGAAIRLNLFGAIILEPYYAFPFQRNATKSSGVLGLHLSAGGF
ncbi:MAG: basic secretory protein-like protein [Bacteroidota bacterium]